MHKFKSWKKEHRICQDLRYLEWSFKTSLWHVLNLLITLTFLCNMYRDYEVCLTEILKNIDGKLHKISSNNTGYTAWYLVPLLTEILNHGQHIDILYTCPRVGLCRMYFSAWTCTHRFADLSSLFLRLDFKTSGLFNITICNM